MILWKIFGLVIVPVSTVVLLILLVRSIFRAVGALFLMNPIVFSVSTVTAVISALGLWQMVAILREIFKETPETPKELDS